MNRFGKIKRDYRAGDMTVAAFDGNARLVPYCLVALLALLVATYLVFMNSMTKKSFEIKRIESAVSDMRRENSRLEVEIAERESIATLSEQVAVLGMVPTEKIDYVTIGSGEVALR